MKTMAASLAWFVACGCLPDKCARYAAVSNFSYANDGIPNLRPRAKTALQEQSIRFPLLYLT